MKNTMTIDGYRAVIQFDPEIEMFRGEFVGLNGGADFYAADIEGLKREGATSLRVFLEMCAEGGIEPTKAFSGKFNVRVPPELHADLVVAATAEGKSLNQWVVEALGREAHI
ncbi:type II toxin-antitoxin system HicB family antitoxin [Halopseudomonas xiamenensis]|uniref:type II toxin-antitoxin system HicB family antitoxin n=1 Tax=Halopseudomonas xiamenensis TaxID=157792 RepID=UPI001629AA6D|nr:type II toxin-antitoxin system HicB family antitoxin [Halopseudomonas xiamenensis]